MSRKDKNELLKYKAVYNNLVTYTKFMKKITLEEIIERIKKPDFLKEHTDKLRATQGDAEQQQYKKNNFPYFILGTFKDGHRLKKNLISSSFFIFDYDHLDEKLPEIKKKLSEDKTVFAYFVSPRGNGLKVIYLLENEIKDYNEFSRLYKQYAEKFNVDLGSEPDKTSDASRACYFSYDPEIYVNLEALPLKTDINNPGVSDKKPNLPKKNIDVKSETPGDRTVSAVRLIGSFIKSGMNKKMTLEFIKLWNDKNDPPLSDAKISETVDDLFDRYKQSALLAVNFEEKNNNYYKVVKQGNDTKQIMITSFKIIPKELLVLDSSDCLKCDIISSQGNEYKDILIENTDWHTKQKFLKSLGHQDCVFLGSENDLQALCQFTQQNIPLRKAGTKVIGLHEGVWVVEGMNIGSDGIRKEQNTVPYEKGSDAFYHRIRYSATTTNEFQSTAQVFFENIFDINEKNKILAYLGWFFAVPVKPLIQEISGSFPLLFHHGGMGSGKTSVAELFAQLAGYKDTKPNSVTMRSFPMLKLLSSTNAIPQWYDEFKVSDMKEMDVDNVLRFMRKSYAGENESKGRADQTIENYKISAPMAIMGEWNINQPAIMERVILIRTNDVVKKNKDMQNAFANIKNLELSGIMPEYIKYCLDQDITKIFTEAKVSVNNHFANAIVAPRIINNLSAMCTGLELLKGFLHEVNIIAPVIDYASLFNDQLEEITGSKTGMVRSAVDQLIEELSIMAEKGEIYGDNYKIVEARSGKRLIAIKFRKVFRDFKIYAKKTNYEGDLLDETSYNKLFDDCEYIEDKNYRAKFSDGTVYVCLAIDIEKAESVGIRIDGFGYNKLPEVTIERKPQMFDI